MDYLIHREQLFIDISVCSVCSVLQYGLCRENVFKRRVFWNVPRYCRTLL